MEVCAGAGRRTWVHGGYGRVRRAAVLAAAACLAPVVAPSSGDASPRPTEHDPVAAAPRPTDGEDDAIGDGYAHPAEAQHLCFGRRTPGGRTRSVCVHWVRRGADSPPGANRRVPAQVRSTVQVLKSVWTAEVQGMGYRAPLRDGGARRGQGPNRGLDVYLVDVGRFGEGGYCARDRRPEEAQPPPRAAVYCVLDDDFAAGQFPGRSGREELELTVAHEFFHAIQAAYDTRADASWLKEGTAVWMEAQVFPATFAGLDGYDFLDAGALVQPETSLDAFGDAFDGQDNEYGSWLFWEFLSEYYGSGDVIRRVWGRVGAHESGNGPYAALTQATIDLPVPDRCVAICAPADFQDVFTEFEAWNARFPTAYAAGAAFEAQLRISSPPPDDVVVLDSLHPTSGARGLATAPLSVRSVEIQPDGSAPLTVAVDLPDGGDAAAVVVPSSGPPTTRRDDGTFTLPDGMAARLLLVNAGTQGLERVFGYEVSTP